MDSPQSPQKRTGRTPIGSTDTCAGTGPTRQRRKHCAGSSGSPPGCGATRPSSISWLWLRNHNDRCVPGRDGQAGFYGLDLYSLHRSMREAVDYLDRVDPDAACRARARYSCFDHASGEDGQAYGYAAAFGAGKSCETQVVEHA